MRFDMGEVCTAVAAPAPNNIEFKTKPPQWNRPEAARERGARQRGGSGGFTVAILAGAAATEKIPPGRGTTVLAQAESVGQTSASAKNSHPHALSLQLVLKSKYRLWVNRPGP
jgi:hypothetical protein